MKETIKKKKSSVKICISVLASFLCCSIPLIADIFKHFNEKSIILLKVSAVLNLPL